MYKIETTNKFDKDYVLIFKRKYDLSLIQKVVEILETEGKLPLKYKPHKLSGNYADNWECHIKADWLLIWTIDEESNIIKLIRTGTHSDLF